MAWVEFVLHSSTSLTINSSNWLTVDNPWRLTAVLVFIYCLQFWQIYPESLGIPQCLQLTEVAIFWNRRHGVCLDDEMRASVLVVLSW